MLSSSSSKFAPAVRPSALINPSSASFGAARRDGVCLFFTRERVLIWEWGRWLSGKVYCTELIPYYCLDVPAPCVLILPTKSHALSTTWVQQEAALTYWLLADLHTGTYTPLNASDQTQEQATFNDLSVAGKGAAHPVSICPQDDSRSSPLITPETKKPKTQGTIKAMLKPRPATRTI